MNDQDRLQELLGPNFDVGGTRKLLVRGLMGQTVGTYDPRAGQVSGFAEVTFYGFDHTPAEELRALGEQTVREQLSSVEMREFEADFDGATVDPLGLSELTNREDGSTFLYVVDLRKGVDGVEAAAVGLGELTRESLRIDVREDDR